MDVRRLSRRGARNIAFEQTGRPDLNRTHESYRLVYEIEQETVWILALVHTAKQWPPVRE